MTPMPMTNILKPCPFCGGEAKLVKSLPGCEYVKCSVCGAGSDDTRGVEKWNTRGLSQLIASPDREKKIRAFMTDVDGKKYQFERTCGGRTFSVSRKLIETEPRP